MKVCLGIHDFSQYSTQLDRLLRLKEHFPEFKVSLFTIPRIKGTNSQITEIWKHLDWMQFIPHGLKHGRFEATEWDYAHFKHEVIPDIERAFEELQLPMVEGFAAPHWRWNNGVVKALNDLGWWGAISPARPKMISTRRFYTYDHAIDQPFWKHSGGILRLHGHTFTTKNNLSDCFDNLLKLPKDVEWKFVTDFVEEND